MRKENQMRRIGMIIQAVLILILSSCYRGEGGTFGYVSDGEGGVIIKNAIVTGDSLVIPSEINSKPVTGIGYECFFKEAGIKSIVIPGSVKVIGERAFGSCTSVESLTIEDGVEKIESWAFHRVPIKELVIPGSVSDFLSSPSSKSLAVFFSFYGGKDRNIRGCAKAHTLLLCQKSCNHAPDIFPAFIESQLPRRDPSQAVILHHIHLGRQGLFVFQPYLA